MHWSSTFKRRLSWTLVLTAGALPPLALADTEDPARAEALFDLPLNDLLNRSISTGVRFEGHTQAGSTLSVVSFSADELRSTHGGSGDLNMVLRNLLPSFNYLTEPLNDGSSHVRAFNLRGLPGDETLVLMNGKRFHRSALVQVGVSSPNALGSQGPDLGQIPVFGLQRVEVLRDGASAQYGSDAIAGVINLILPERAAGGEIALERGVTGRGDGAHTRLSLQAGTRLGEQGFFSLTAEGVRRAESSRGTQRPDAAYYASAGLAVADPAQIWGSPQLDSRRMLWNGRVDLGGGASAYMFGNFSQARSNASFNYRALTRGFFNTNINTANGTLVPCAAVPGDQFGYLSARQCLDTAKSNPALFNFQQWFPAGFTPRLEADNSDFSQVLGVKGKMAGEASFDLSVSYARNRLAYQLQQTINPSLGPASPTTFALGSLAQIERNVNADVVWPVNAALSLAGGAEWRQEIAQNHAGELAARETGPYAPLGIGSNGMPGIDTSAAGRFARTNQSVYVDSQYHLSDDWLLAAAARAERYSDFGNASSGKLSVRYLLNEHFSLRGTAGTGFRAPSPGQSHLTNIGHNAGNAGARVLIAGIIPPTSDIARFFGARPLEPESSRNVSFGLAYRRTGLSVTLDAYRIRVHDRIVLSNPIFLTDALRGQMQAAGVQHSEDYDSIIVFNNAVDSVSQGADLSATYAIDSRAGQTEWKLNVSHVQTRASPNGSAFVPSEQTLYNLAHQLPATRASLGLRHQTGIWSASASAVYYGPFSVHDGAGVTAYPSKTISNLELGLTPHQARAWTFAAGVGNVFNTQAQRGDGTLIGSPFISENPFEYEGRSFYMNARYAF